MPSQEVSGGEEAQEGKDAWVSNPRGSRLYVFNLPGRVHYHSARRVFGLFGQIDDLQVMPAGNRKRERACATVLFSKESEADACLHAMNKGFEMKRGDGNLQVSRGRAGAPADVLAML